MSNEIVAMDASHSENKDEAMDVDKECDDKTSPEPSTTLAADDISDIKEIKKEEKENDISSGPEQEEKKVQEVEPNSKDAKEEKVKDLEPNSMDAKEEKVNELKPNSKDTKEVKVNELKPNSMDSKEEKVNELKPNSMDTKEEEVNELKPNSMDTIQLSVEGAAEDANEKKICMSPDEVKLYLLKKIGEYMNTSINPLYNLRSRIKEVETRGKEQVEEFAKLYKALQLMERKQEIFLRKIDILPKITMAHASVSAQLPLQPVTKPESPHIPKELSITKIDTPPSNKASSVSTNQTKSSEKSTAKPSNIECIDLTDDTELPHSSSASKSSNMAAVMLRHPAPLPPRPFSGNAKIPPKPRLKISAEDRGIVLQWDMPPNSVEVTGFDIFGYQEQKTAAINTLLWKKIGHVKAMSLPMACTLTQFVDGNRYHFSIRAVDVNGRCGHYSDAISIVYKQKSSLKK